MQHYLFASPSTLDRNAFDSIEALHGVCKDFFSVGLSGKEELEILLGLLGLEGFVEESLVNSKNFSSVIDLSKFKLPEFSKPDFEIFYQSWILKTGRKASMDEYGQFIFLQGQAKNWNQRPSRVVLSEKS